MKKQWFVTGTLLFTLPLAACGSSEEEAKTEKSAFEQIKEEGKLVVGTAGTLYPSSFHAEEGSELTGFDVEIMKEVAKRLELEVEFKEMAFDNMLTGVQNGQIDIAANDITITDDRKEKFNFSVPYKYTYGSAIVRKSDLSGIESLEDLKGKKAAGEATTVFMQVAKKLGAEEVIYDNATNDQYLGDVSSGRTDVILNDFYLQSLAVAFFPEFDLAVHPNIAYNPSEVGFVMAKENNELQQEVNKALEGMLKDGTVMKLSETFYNGADVSQPVDVEATIVELD